MLKVVRFCLIVELRNLPFSKGTAKWQQYRPDIVFESEIANLRRRALPIAAAAKSCPQYLSGAVQCLQRVLHLVRRTDALRSGTVSDELATDGFPLSHGLQSVIANLIG